MNKIRTITLLLAMGVLPACQTLSVDPFPQPLRDPKQLPEAPAPDALAGAQDVSQTGQERFARPPRVAITHTRALGREGQLGKDLAGEKITASFNDVPLIAFINEVFGNQLGMSYVIAPALRNKKDLVTLRLTEPLEPADLFDAARAVLVEYGVGMKEDKGILTFVATMDVAGDDIPLLITGRTLPEVPASHRLVFQLVTLKVVRTSMVAGWLKQIFAKKELVVQEDAARNALLLRGKPSLVTQAVSMINVLDQPLLKSSRSLLVSPVFMDVDEMAKQLEKVLRAEGYEPSRQPTGGSLVLLPLESANKLVIFAPEESVIKHVKEWVKILDDRQKDKVEKGVFTYLVKNTQARDVYSTLLKVRGGLISEPAEKASGAAAKTKTTQAEPEGGSKGIVVDEKRNLLIFRGSGAEWAELLGVIKELDKAVPSVLIEVLLAEITLTDGAGSGLEFAFTGGLGKYGVSGGTLNGLGLGSKAFSMVLDNAGATRAALNLFYEDSRVVIRSSPKLLVKSGEEASIEVGNEIPVITQTSADTTTTAGTTNILQEVTYRKTGVQMKIKPIVQANGLVDLAITQELSEARPAAATSLEGSPTILNRKVQTSLTLRDGGSLLMGGIISNSQSAGQTGVPLLGRTPVLGRLFRSDTYQKDRTELVILVIPYVVSSHEEGWDLTEQMKQRLILHRESVAQ